MPLISPFNLKLHYILVENASHLWRTLSIRHIHDSDYFIFDTKILLNKDKIDTHSRKNHQLHGMCIHSVRKILDIMRGVAYFRRFIDMLTKRGVGQPLKK